jgi:lipoprotein-releasing system ATP-binding protein
VTVLRVTALEKTYAPLSAGSDGLTLFRDLSLELERGEMVAIVGASGAGKSSLLHLLAALDTPTAGSIMCGDVDVTRLSPAQAARFRHSDVGYVWQFHYLLPEFTAVENVAMPLLARGTARGEALSEAQLWLDRVHLGGRAQNRSGELSGGEQQRVSIARALITKPKLLLADEPTGDLDGRTAEEVFLLLRSLHREEGLTSLLVTHNLDFAGRCDRVLRLADGRLATQQ